MFKFLVNKKTTKQSLKNLSVFLKDKGYSIPHHILLEALAKVFFVKNWNTLKAMSETNNEIPIFKNESKYIFIFKTESQSEEILEIFKKNLLQEKKFDFYIEQLLFENNTYYIYFSTKTTFNNWITYLILVGNQIKKSNIKMDRFEYIRHVVDVENFMPYLSAKN